MEDKTTPGIIDNQTGITQKQDSYTPYYTLWSGAFYLSILYFTCADSGIIASLLLLCWTGCMLVWLCKNVYRKYWCRVSSIIAAPIIVTTLYSILMSTGLILYSYIRPCYRIVAEPKQVQERIPDLETWVLAESTVFLGGGDMNILVYDDSDQILLPSSSRSKEWNKKANEINLLRLIDRAKKITHDGGHFYNIYIVY